jgi:hypothetical protein
MRRTSRTLTTGLVAVAFLVAGCGGSEGGGGKLTPSGTVETSGASSIAGTYECSLEGAGPTRSIDVFEFREDGTIIQTIETLHRTFEGTWSTQGDSVKILSESGNLTMTIEGDRLVDPHGFTCTPA